MEIINTEDTHYASQLLLNGFHSNVNSALLEVDRVKSGELKKIHIESPRYYLIHDNRWKFPYKVKQLTSVNPDIYFDPIIEHYKF